MFDSPLQGHLVYIYSIPDANHAGLLKIGEAGISLNPQKELYEYAPNCQALRASAENRIKQQTATAGVKYVLHHAELLYRVVKSTVFWLHDKDVHKVLTNEGIHQVKPNGKDGNEWFKTDIDHALLAIQAAKDGRQWFSVPATLPSEEDETHKPIVLRDEQEDAIRKTLDAFKNGSEMLWYAKMRFGKTLTALETVRRGGFKRVIIATHRPVVGGGWHDDFTKLFTAEDGYVFRTHTGQVGDGFIEPSDADWMGAKDAENDAELARLRDEGAKFIYFASIQDLRGSQRVGGKFNKNNAVFDMPWDLVIVDEAHEGTQTELGKNVSVQLVSKKTKLLSLSGTPFNLLEKYGENNTYVWDYVQEQRRKKEWSTFHPGEKNPYAGLPEMRIHTYSLGDVISGYSGIDIENKAFSFREFFRTWTGGYAASGEEPGAGARVYCHTPRRMLLFTAGSAGREVCGSGCGRRAECRICADTRACSNSGRFSRRGVKSTEVSCALRYLLPGGAAPPPD